MERIKDAYFTRNVLSSAAVEFFWGLGFPIVLESTFLQLFLQKLGASGFIIGCVPSIFIMGISCFPLFAGYLTRNSRLKKSAVLSLHLLSALSIFILGWSMLLVKEAALLPLFFSCYTVFSLCMGLTIPVWLNYLVRIFSERRAVQGIGYMMLFQNAGKILSSFFILKVVERHAFSIPSSSVVFIVTGLTFIIGSLFFIFTKELIDNDGVEKNTESFLEYTKKSFLEIVNNRRFLLFLGADLDYYVILTILSFYANYAHRFFGVDQAVAAGGFVACIYGGSITVNIFLGALNYLGLKQKFILSKCVTTVVLLLLISVPSTWFFFLISYMLGAVRAIRNMVYTPSVKLLSGKDDATMYFALAPILTLPVGIGFPLFFGKLLDIFKYLGADSYRLLFGLSIIFIGCTLYLTLRTKIEKR